MSRKLKEELEKFLEKFPKKKVNLDKTLKEIADTRERLLNSLTEKEREILEGKFTNFKSEEERNRVIKEKMKKLKEKLGMVYGKQSDENN
ncbi:MAG TPA: hypothetical protein ENF81_06120 [Thermotogaceae bacterium]|nr:hypothetical protein [Thermotogaceae bacterium]